jgi:hypothetical protein
MLNHSLFPVHQRNYFSIKSGEIGQAARFVTSQNLPHQTGDRLTTLGPMHGRGGTQIPKKSLIFLMK